jgi:hypothetical protein
MTQVSDEYEAAQTAFAEALAAKLERDVEDILEALASESVSDSLADLHTSWLQFSDENDFGAEMTTQDLLDAMADEAAIVGAEAEDIDRQRAMDEETAWADSDYEARGGADDDWDEAGAYDWEPGDEQ